MNKQLFFKEIYIFFSIFTIFYQLEINNFFYSSKDNINLPKLNIKQLFLLNVLDKCVESDYFSIFPNKDYMTNGEFIINLESILKEGKLNLWEEMKKHSTFKIGGPAKYFIKPSNLDELISTIYLCNKYKIPFFILGNGSNLLVSDEGYNGAVIQIKDNFSKFIAKNISNSTIVTAGAGISMHELSLKIANLSLTGFEFGIDIPGTLGGAITMNAGCYDGEIKDKIINAKVLTRKGEIKILDKKDLSFGFRRSLIKISGDILLEGTFIFKQGIKNNILAKMDNFHKRRWKHQPMNLPSAGTFFIRPKNYHLGEIIKQNNLTGYRIGDIMISPKNLGFFVNMDYGTAYQAFLLKNFVISTVQQNNNLILEPEVILLGF